MTQEQQLIVLVLSLAGFIQGLTGFGFGLTAMATLPMIVGLSDAQDVITLSSVAVTSLTCLVNVRNVLWPHVGKLVVGSAVGVPLGFLLVDYLPQSIVTQLLGAAICLMVLLDVLILRRYRLQWPGWTAPCVGLASGLLTGAFNIGGPPLVAYVYAQPGSKREHVGTLSMVFIMGGIVRLAMMLTHETVAPRIWGAAGLTILPMLAAVYYGHWLLHFVSQRVLRAAVYTALFFLGIRYLISVS